MMCPIIGPGESKMQTTVSISGRSPPPAYPFQPLVSKPCDTHGQEAPIAGRSVTFRHQRSSLPRIAGSTHSTLPMTTTPDHVGDSASKSSAVHAVRPF